MRELLALLNRRLAAGESVAAAAIVAHQGSTPRSAGSRMLLFADGGTAGSVGGGTTEALILGRAGEVLDHGGTALVSLDLCADLAAEADMICGGSLRVFVERIPPGDTALFQELENRMDRGQRGLVLTDLETGTRTLLGPDREGDSPGDIQALARRMGAGLQSPVFLDPETGRFLLDPWNPGDPLLVLGAGHVGRAVARMAARVGFRVSVLDDRPEFADPKRLPETAEVAVTPGFAHCLEGRDPGPEASVVILTRGHAHDRAVLAQVLRTRAGYIGMIGSRRKREAVYARLLAEGFRPEDLDRVHCPIGLDIGAETPEEIAVSVTAQLIQARAARRGA